MKELIDSMKMTIKEFSETYEIPYNTVRQWYNEKRQAPAWVKKLIEKLVQKTTQGEQIEINEKIIYCNVKTAYRTYYTKEEDANKEITFYKNKMHGYTLKREIYKKITP